MDQNDIDNKAPDFITITKPEIPIVTIPGARGGTLRPQQPGSPALPGAGRKPNPFKHHILELAEEETEVILTGRLVNEDGTLAETTARVSVKLPGAIGIVMKAYRMAAKGDAQARKWLTETGWGKNVTLSGDPDNPIEGGFVLMLPSNNR